MVEILDSDLIPLKSFPLKWRWTDERWNLLPPKDVRQITPLTQIKAGEINEMHLKYLSLEGLIDKFFEQVKMMRTEVTDSLIVQNWLKSRIYNEQKSIIVSWTKDLAVKTTLEIFCNYWDDFCYPSSDDVSVSPLDLSWLLFYSHSEYLVFGKVKQEFL